MWNKQEVRKFFKEGGRIWDCQYAEYLLEGQQQHAMMCSLDSVVEKYGGTLKIDKVKDLWAQGVNTPDIPEDLLMDYLLGNASDGIDGDVSNTEKVFLGQVERARRQGKNFTNMVLNRMNSLLCTTEMEYNGLMIDREQGEEDRAFLLEKLEDLEYDLDTYLPAMPDELEFNWNSVVHKSALIFGGTIAYEKWTPHTDKEGQVLFCQKKQQWPLFGGEAIDPIHCEWDEDHQLYRWPGVGYQDTFKSGKREGEAKTKAVTVPDRTRPKGAKRKFNHTLVGFTEPKPEWKGTLTDGAGGPVYSTSSEIIKYLGETLDGPFFKLIASKQKISKDLGTYYWLEDKHGRKKGMLTLVSEHGYIHHKLNHTNTVTGRLSSSDPNMQNIPRGDKSLVKRMFVSRFGSDGCMVEIDYSQLEVIVQAVLSHDDNLARDIRQGVDFHLKRLSAATGADYTVLVDKHRNGDAVVGSERTRIKGFTFQRAYGAGAEAIALSTGMSVDKVKELIAAEEKLYPKLHAFNERVMREVRRNPKYLKHIDVDGYPTPVNYNQWVAETGTIYTFEQRKAPEFMREKGEYVSFSPTETKNYPVQGEAGLIVQAMLGSLYRWFIINDNFNDKAFLVNTVHDCVWIDCHRSIIPTVVNGACQILEAVGIKFKQDFNLDIRVPFKVEAEIGPNMLDMRHYERNS